MSEETLVIDQDEDIDNKCPICLKNLHSSQVVTLTCGHKFHTACVIQWFRTGSPSCPCCRAAPDSTGFARWRDRRSRLRLMLQFGRRKNAPLSLKRLIDRRRKKEKRRLERVEKYRKWKKSVAGKLFKQLLKIDRKGRRACYKSWGFDNIETQILNFPVRPVILPLR